jgi:hypothetical protein
MSAWLTQAGLAGTPETDIVSGFCERCVAAGLPLGRANLFIDTRIKNKKLAGWSARPHLAAH